MSTLRHFLQRHWLHWLLLPVLAVTLYTGLHEAAHAFAVWIQGGHIETFRWLPNNESLGMVAYYFPRQTHYSERFIALAPYLMWLGLAGTVFLISFWLRSPHFYLYSSLFLWLYLAPLADIALAASGYAFFGMANDLYHAWGAPGLLGQLTVVALGLTVVFLSYGVHQRLYGETALPLSAFLSLASMFVVALLAWGFFW